MRARVKPECSSPTQSAGILFSREWQTVPAWAEGEIKVNPYLEIERPEPEAQTETQTPATNAVKLVDPKPGARRGVRKL